MIKLYIKKKTKAEFNWDTDVTEYYKFDAVFLGREQYGDDESGNEDFILFELNGDDTSRDSVIIISGANTLPQIKPGQYVTIYCRLFSGSTPNGAPLYVIDHIEIPAEDFSFTATHRTIEKTDIMFPPGDGAYLTIPVDSGVEVQVLGKFSRDTEENDGKGGLIKGRWMWLVTSDGFGGWVFSPYLEPLPHLFAQEIDKSLYQETTLDYLNHYYEIPKTIEYYKFDGVYVERYESNVSARGNEFFKFFEFDGDYSKDRGSNFEGPNTLQEIKPGQFVTVYLRLFPETRSNGTILNTIDHIEIPAEDFSFTATHKTNRETDILFAPEDIVFVTLDSGVEVQVLGRNFYVSKKEDGKGGLLTGYWMWLITSDGFGGWVFSPYLEPLPHAANIEIPTNFSFEATHKAIKETTIWENLGREPRTTIDTGVEVQVYETDLDVVTSEGETGSCVYLVTANGYLGYAFAAHFEPLPQTVVVETPPPVVDNESESSVEPEAKWSSGFPLRWVIAGLGAALLVVIIAVVMVKRKKK